MPFWEKVDFVSYIISILLAGVFTCLCFRRAGGKDSDKSLRYFLLSGVFACICLADLFYVAAWSLSSYPITFSAADLSWIGGYVFLIAADLHLMNGWTADEKKTAKKYRLPALIAPIIVTGFTAVYVFLTPEITFNYVFSGISMVICAYFTLWMLLARWKGVGRQSRYFHMAVSLFLAADLLYMLFSALGWDSFAIPATFSGELYVAAEIWMFLSLRKEASA